MPERHAIIYRPDRLTKIKHRLSTKSVLEQAEEVAIKAEKRRKVTPKDIAIALVAGVAMSLTAGTIGVRSGVFCENDFGLSCPSTTSADQPNVKLISPDPATTWRRDKSPF